jgi:predicted phage baseplate assembly protein
VTVLLPLPTLDDRRWPDLVEEARSLIPLYAPDWTEHNVSDPGITILELLAWIAEMQVFQLDQVPARHRRKFLQLVGVEPRPPRPSRCVVRFAPAPGGPSLRVPATTECEVPGGPRFRTLEDVWAVPASIETITAHTAAGDVVLDGRRGRGEPLAVLGEDPRPGDALVLGLSAALPVGRGVALAVTCEHDGDGALPDAHHSARTAWELRVGPGRWRRLVPDTEVVDGTRALTRDGIVRISAPELTTPDADGRHLLRCRLVAGRHDAAPRLRDVALNGEMAEQAVPAATLTLRLAPGATVAAAPLPGRRERLGIERSPDGDIVALDTGNDTAPALLVLAYRAATDAEPGLLTVEAEAAATGDGRPALIAEVSEPPVAADSVRVWTVEGSGADTAWRRWTLRDDLDASRAADAHAVLDAAAGLIVFGDGVHGRTPPPGALVVVEHHVTLAAAGVAAAGAIDRLSDSPHNRGLQPPAVAVTNPVATAGGAAAETLEEAEARAGALAERRSRAVTLADYEELARSTPGTRVARAHARANVHPGLQCVEAVGVVTVVVVPYLSPGRPEPSRGLLRAVAGQLEPRRVVGTRIEVTGPVYTEVAVRARVQPLGDVPAGPLADAVAAAVDAFLDPLTGGPDEDGWPLGRDVVRSEVLQVIDGVPGVDHVVELDLLRGGCPTCGNVCLEPLALVAAGTHAIEVVRG